MTFTIDETSLDFKRDRFGRPLVSDPSGGTKMLAYGRPSSFGDMIADKYNLQLWGKRQVVLGMAHTPSLVARTMACTIDDKAVLNAIAEDALTASKSGERADIGTALHKIIERQVSGEDVALVEPYAADVAAFWACLEATGFTIHAHDGRPMSEIKCVNDEHRLAGTFDLVLQGPDGTLYVADLKTGSSLDFGHIGYAVQLAVYLDSKLYDIGTGERADMPSCHPTTGIIIHLPAGEARCELKAVDLEAGREMARLCAAVRDTRKRKTITDYKPISGIAKDIKTVAEAQAAGILPTIPGVDEGRMLDGEVAKALHTKLVGLPADERTLALEWFAQAQASGRPIKFSDNPTERRCAIAQAIIEWVSQGEEKMRTAIALVLGADQVQPTFTTGALLGLLTIDEANALCGI